MNPKVFDRLVTEASQRLEEPQQLPRRPSMDSIAFCVSVRRKLLNWKASTLADFASVSLSTVERVERGDFVSDASLQKIALALGYESSYFIEERIPLSDEEAAHALSESWADILPCEVNQLTTANQIRALSRGCMMLKLGMQWSEKSAAVLDDLAETIDLVAFVRSDFVDERERGQMRQLYAYAFEYANTLRELGMTLLVGTLPGEKVGLKDWPISILSISPKKEDPGAINRKLLLLDRKLVRTAIGQMSLGDDV